MLTPIVRTRVNINGVLVPVSTRVDLSAGLTPVDTRIQLPAQPPPPPPPPPVGDRWLGMYLGNPVDDGDNRYFNIFGHYPMGAGSYYTSQTVNTTYELARVRRGTNVFLDLDTKANANMIVEVNNWSTTGQNYVDRFLNAAEQIAVAALEQDAEVHVAFCHEYTVKWQQLNNGTTLSGVAYTTGDRVLSTFAGAASRFYARAAAIAPTCKTLWWMGGTWSGNIDAQLWPMLTTGCHGVAFDDYVTSNNSFALPTSDWTAVVNLIRNSSATQQWNQGAGPKLYIGEFGIDKSHGVTRVTQYYQDVLNAMETHDIVGAIQFSRDKTDPNGDVVAYDITTADMTSAKDAFAAAVAVLRENPNPGGPPNPPASLRANGTPTTTSAPIAWNASTLPTGAAPVQQYRVKVNGTQVGTTTGLTFTLTGLTASTTYSVTVTAYNGEESAPSNTLSVTTAAAPAAPNAPASLRLNGTTTSTTVPLAWNAATVPGGAPAVTEYRVYRGATLAATVAAPATTVTISGLTAATSYTFTVRAFNGQESAASNSLSVTTPGTPISITPILGVSSTITNLGFDPDSSGVIDTASGLYISRLSSTASARVFLTHNDSGHASPTGTEDNIRVLWFDDVAPHNLLRNSLLTIGGNPVPIMDTEDMGWYFDGTNYKVLVADIGLQGGTRATREIYRFTEPLVTPGQALVTTPIAAERFVFNRPVSSIAPGTHDMEAMWVDTRQGPGLGDVYLIQKRGGTTVSSGSVWRAPASAFVAGGNDNMGNVFTEIAIVPNIDAGDQNGITSADISEDGDHLYMKNYQRYWGWNRAPGETIEQCLDRGHDWVTGSLSDSQQEATCFDRGKTPGRIYGIGENVTATLKYRTTVT